MGKNPAVLFYTADFLVGTLMMSLEQRGAYITLLCLQHQTGRLSPDDVRRITDDKTVLSKFVVDEDGNYYNKRMELEGVKRDVHRGKQRDNINRRWGGEVGNGLVIPNVYQSDTKVEDSEKIGIGLVIPNAYQSDTKVEDSEKVGIGLVIPLENENEKENEKDHFLFVHTQNTDKPPDGKKDVVVDTGDVSSSKVGEGGVAGGPAPPKKPEAVRHKRGQYGWVRLSDEEYNRLLTEFGEENVRKYITFVDEYAQGNGNARKYRDWNLVVRKAIRERWGEKAGQSAQNKTSTVNGRKLYDYERSVIEELRRGEAVG